MQLVKDARISFLDDIIRTRQHITKVLDETQQWLTSRFDEAEQTISAQATSIMHAVPKVMEVDMSQ
jgi:hypothetical protein